MVAILTVVSISVAFASVNYESVVKDYEEKRNELEANERSERDVMRVLYEITQRMKKYSKRRNILNQKMFFVSGDVKKLARQIAELEIGLTAQKQRLSKRLRALYMLGDEGLVRAIFSSASSQELDQTLRYLKKVSEYDFRLIKDYQQSMADLTKRRERLNVEVRKLVKLKNTIGVQEEKLAGEQKAKADLLSKIKNDKVETVREINGIKQWAVRNKLEELLDTSFYDFKGRMKAPVRGKLIRDFGLFEDEEFHYRLAHKGVLFQVKPKTRVRNLHKGRVAFAASVKGHGMTLVIDHGDHYYSVYALNDNIFVKTGDAVSAGQVLAESSEFTYFEIRHFSDAIDPKPWLRSGEASS